MSSENAKRDVDKPAVRQFLLYLSHRFGIDYEQAMPDEEEWRFIRNKLQKLTAMNDLEQALCRYRRALDRQLEREEEHERQEEERRRNPKPGPPWEVCAGIPDPPGFMRNGDPDLPQGWLTVLEAAYEHFDDHDGLVNLNTFYYITECDYRPMSDSGKHLDKVQELCGEHWKEQCERMISLIAKYYPELLAGDGLFVFELVEECEIQHISIPIQETEKEHGPAEDYGLTTKDHRFFSNEWTAKEWLRRTIMGIRNRLK